MEFTNDWRSGSIWWSLVKIYQRMERSDHQLDCHWLSARTAVMPYQRHFSDVLQVLNGCPTNAAVMSCQSFMDVLPVMQWCPDSAEVMSWQFFMDVLPSAAWMSRINTTPPCSSAVKSCRVSLQHCMDLSAMLQCNTAALTTKTKVALVNVKHLHHSEINEWYHISTCLIINFSQWGIKLE